MKAEGPSGCPFGSALPRPADQAVRWADAVYGRKLDAVTRSSALTLSRDLAVESVDAERRAKHVPEGDLRSVGATDRNPSERRAFGTLSKWPCDRMKPPSVEHNVNDGARGARTDVSEKVWCSGKSYDADTIT